MFSESAFDHHEEQRNKLECKWQEIGFVFPNSHGGFFNTARLHQMFKRLLLEVGLPPIRFHDLCHSAATLLLGMGVHPKYVQELLGHSNIRTTIDIYSHIMPSMHHEVMKKWDEWTKHE